jgi:branched-chain amino acid transport system permease protein
MILQYLSHLLILVGIYAVLGLSFQLTLGYTGLLNLGFIVFYGLGAYTSTLLTVHGVSFPVSFVLAGGVPMLFAFLIALLVNRLQGDYLALVTMGISFIVYAVLMNWTSLTQGPQGIAGIGTPVFFGLALGSKYSYLVFVLLLVSFCYFTLKRILGSPFGKVLEAIRGDELAVRTLGKNVLKMKMIALGLSGFFAGLAGSAYAHYISYIDPDSFAFLQLGPVLAIVMIGGLASLHGTLLAALIIVILPESLRFINLPASVLGPARQMLYAATVLLIIMYRPKGISGRVTLE